MLAATYVELGIGITFAAMGYELDKILPKKKVSFISVRHLFESNYFAVVMRKERELRPYKERFLNLLLNKSIEK
jgi:hypothetical protein